MTGATAVSLTLQWAAPGDDGNIGTASTYDLRYSTSGPIDTEAEFVTAAQASGEPTPAAAGTVQSMTVPGLISGTTYYFAMKTADEIPNWSGLSNSPSGTTSPFLAYSTAFDAADGWTFSAASLGVGWGVDATPVSMPGGSSHSATNSLNYNNGVDYDNLLANSGSATSPAIDLTFMPSPYLVFWCNYKTDTTGTATDRRWVRVGNADFSVTHLSAQAAGTAAAPYQCAAMGTWHAHAVPLASSWGTVRVRFFFDSVTASGNANPGWFVDDLSIDQAPPAAVTDLAVTGTTSTTATLKWTAPGDDGPGLSDDGE